MKLDEATGRANKSAEYRIADHNRIIRGTPFFTKDVAESHLQPIPAPVCQLECPERPQPGWEVRGIRGRDGWRFYWMHPDYNERARMWQFKIRGESDSVKRQFDAPVRKDHE